MILIVEDNRHDILLTRRALTKAGVTEPLQVASDGLTALQLLEKETPSLLLLDLKVPLRSGHEILEWMAAHTPPMQVPTLVLSTSNSSADRDKAVSLGAHGYLLKPLDPKQLAAALRGLGLEHLLS